MENRDKELLIGMLDFAVRIEKRVACASKDDFMSDLDIQDAVLYAIGQLGEKVSHLSEEFLEKYPEKDWYVLKGLRNRIFHAYEDIDISLIYNITVQNNKNTIKC